MNKILISVVEKDNVLRFTSDDNSQKDFEIEGENGKRTIIKDNQIYYLIEDSLLAFERIKVGNFKHCIFLCDILFEGQNFYETPDFSHTIFTKNANFKKTTFTKNADFLNAVFTQGANFKDAIFTKNANFLSAIFTKNANFFSATFTQNADFYDATFNQDSDFGNTKIQGILNFTKVKKIKLDLQLAIVDRIEYGNTEFTSDNRETLLILKNVALKQNDQIRALEFHQQEYRTHFKNIKLGGDKLILGFEYWASNFGTSAIVATSRFIGVIMLFYILINGFEGDVKTIIDFILPTSYDIDSIFKNYIFNIQQCDRWLFLIYKTLQLIMIYEIIKSFRKFSRQL
ncbi:hypothetical protein SPONL_2091 [uncultured Candidatus Thioglobus sp.]|nr:hypothetical protein SPONL_2091 [uncultured Candidatus Thioglobus sp.]